MIESWKQGARRLKAETYALYLAYRHPQTPWYAKAWAGLVVAYAFSPIDLVPDFIPLLGYLDDLILVPAGIAVALRLIPAEVMAECRRRAQEEGADKPVSKLAAAVIAAIWLGLAAASILWLVNLLR